MQEYIFYFQFPQISLFYYVNIQQISYSYFKLKVRKIRKKSLRELGVRYKPYLQLEHVIEMKKHNKRYLPFHSLKF